MTTAAGPPIRIRGLTKRYGEAFAVKDLNLDIQEGEVFSLLGPNGAGKTTGGDPGGVPAPGRR